MAKQSGIHQLRGKVGEHSYYRQTGVATGIVRAINQAMSQKVKTDGAFANTRLNNREFGQAGRLSSMLANYISPKFRPMVLPFSQSKMAKVLLEYIKLDTSAPWGGRNITTANSVDAQIAALNAVVKNRFEDWDIHIVGDEEKSTINLAMSESTLQKMSSIGANGAIVRVIAATSWIGTYDSATQKYAPSYARGSSYDHEISATTAEDWDVIYTLRPAPPEGWPAFEAGRMGVVIILPYRIINDAKHILQEYCTYFAWGIADGPIN